MFLLKYEHIHYIYKNIFVNTRNAQRSNEVADFIFYVAYTHVMIRSVVD